MSRVPYVPPLRWHVLTPLYDRVMERIMPMDRVRRALAAVLEDGPGPVLDLGCGTGALLHSLERTDTIGLDLDPRALARARDRWSAGAWVRGDCRRLPFATASVGAVATALHFHHLSPGAKAETLAEVARVLEPGGRFALLDWTRADSWVGRAAFLSVRCVDGFENTRHHAIGTIPQLLVASGLESVEEKARIGTAFGELALWIGRRP